MASRHPLILSHLRTHTREEVEEVRRLVDYCESGEQPPPTTTTTTSTSRRPHCIGGGVGTPAAADRYFPPSSRTRQRIYLRLHPPNEGHNGVAEDGRDESGGGGHGWCCNEASRL